MNGPAHPKVTARHLKRDAFLYVRQSTIRQVFENIESTKRQYALRERAVALGWPIDRIHVIDCDLGQSGASATDRKGFQQLVAEVGLGNAGIVLGLEVSRLARNSSDWHRLLEICALTDTLLLDEDGVYAPGDFNDRLLLGLKGTMSEAELHMLRARLRGGILNKARRGELRMPLPVGLAYDNGGHVVLDPDKRVQDTLRLFFQTYRRVGSATAVVKHFRGEDIPFPRRLRGTPGSGRLVWGPLTHTLSLRVLHNPRYAGAFVFGRTRQRRLGGGKVQSEKLPSDEWQVLLPGTHDGYISWDEYEENLRRLRENSQACGADRRSPPREGPALLQGLAICGVCGNRMTVRYHVRSGKRVPDYMCQRAGIDTATPVCQQIPGAKIDEAIGALLIDTVTPMALDVTLHVQAELQRRLDESDQLRRQHVERARYEAERAQRRYMKVDPENRLVADVVEAEWNEKLRALNDAQETYEKQRAADRDVLQDEERERILALASDFPALWRNPSTSDRERKRMVKLLVEDVTLRKGKEVSAHVRFKGGKTHSLSVPLALSAWQLRQTSPDVVAQIDALLDHYTEGQIAAILNERGLVSGEKKPFRARIVQRLRRDYRLKTRYDRLRDAGMLTRDELAKILGVSIRTVSTWRRHGLLRAHAYDEKKRCLYEHPGDDPPVKSMGHKLSDRRRIPEVAPNRTKEVQCEA